MSDISFPTLLPEMPAWARCKIDPKRVDQWDEARCQWATEWDDETREKMWPRLLAAHRNNMNEALDAVRAEVETNYATSIQRWKNGR